VRRAGASAVVLVSEPLAAAVGAGIDVGGCFARMIVDIGHGVTDCAVFRAGEVVASTATRVACGDLESGVASFVLDRHNLRLSADATRRLLKELSFDPLRPKQGTTRVTGLLPLRAGSAEAVIRLDELVEALRPAHERIVSGVASFVRELPAKICVEVIESGIDLTGGGALLDGMAESIGNATLLDVRRVPDALGSVVRGARRMIGNVEKQHLWE
jgi:rod shape-determining protein MreB